MYLKIFDETLFHAFTIKADKVLSYNILKDRGEIVAVSSAEITDIQEIDDKMVSMRILTAVIEFEIVRNRNYSYDAYKAIRLHCNPLFLFTDI